ncbi:hypothetical protein [Mucilaginibacter sp.]|uniref:hypothetical protein n=1 Tax=Mucilaginibacter sp. TaxID=1882438 RepID=UPI003D102E0A
MKRKLLFAIFFIMAILLLSAALMLLWNYLLPQIAHLPRITYWQALGLLVLCRILFGRFRFGNLFGGRPGGEPNLLGTNERNKSAFKEEWRKRCEMRKQH